MHVTQALRTGPGGLDSASNGECCKRQCAMDLGAHAFADRNKNSLPPALAGARAAFVGAGSGAFTAASVLPATAAGAWRQQNEVTCKVGNDFRCNDVTITTPRVGEEEPKSACPHLLAVPKGGAVCCDATVAVAPIARCIEPSCVGMRSVNAKPQSVKRTGAVACDVRQLTANADSSHKPCNKRTRGQQATANVEHIPLIVKHESDAQATEQFWLAALMEALAEPIDAAWESSTVDAFPSTSPVAVSTTTAHAVADGYLQLPRHVNAIPVPTTSSSAAGHIAVCGRLAMSASKACASTFSTSPAYPNTMC